MATKPHPMETGGSLRVKRDYESRGIPGDWGRDRVTRLCNLMQISEYEIATMCCIPYPKMRKHMREGRFPGPESLHFSLLESHLLSENVGRQEPIIQLQ